MFTEIEAQWFGGDFSKDRLKPLADELLKLQLFPELEKITTDTMRIDFGTHWAHILRHKVSEPPKTRICLGSFRNFNAIVL